VVRFLCRWIRNLTLSVLVLWSLMAIYYSNLPGSWLRSFCSFLFACALGVAVVRVRPWWVARFVIFAACGVIVIWFLLIPPSNNRDWQADVAMLPYAEISGDQVTLHNVRNCDYRSETDYTVRHYDKVLELSKLRSVDLFLVYWGSPLIAHTMLSFGFEGRDYVCFSIGTRKQKGEEYSAIKGLFRQFELTYVLADERDLVRLRTNFRHEQVYLYRLKTEPEVARLVFLDYLKTMNSFKDQPEWYNALTSNCTTNIRGHTAPYARKSRWNWRLLVNGFVDELGFEVGALDRSLPVEQLKARSLVNKAAQAANDDPSFSTRIRQGLPGIEEGK